MGLDAERHPLGYAVAQGAAWQREDWGDEQERLLRFARDAGVFEQYRPRLRGVESLRDEALAEIGVAAFLVNGCGWTILEWEPESGTGKRGDLLARAPGMRRAILVEIKAPGWESQISENIRKERVRLPKYMDGEVLGSDPAMPIRHAVRKAYPKFDWRTPTLLVVADDLHVPLHVAPDWVGEALYRPRIDGVAVPGGWLRAGGSLAEDGVFVDPRCARLGAVATLNRDVFSATGYTCHVFRNPHALLTTAVPRRAFRGLGVYDGPSVGRAARAWRFHARVVATLRTACAEGLRRKRRTRV